MVKVEDLDLVTSLVLNNDSDALRELFKRHLGIFRAEQKKIPMSFRDEFSEPRFMSMIWSAAKSYSKDKGTQFSTWLYNEVRFARLAYYKQIKKFTQLQDAITIESSITDSVKLPLYDDDAVDLLSAYLEKFQIIPDSEKNLNKDLSKRECLVIKLRYFSKFRKLKTFEDISKVIGLSTWGTVLVHNKAIKKIKDNIKNILQS